MRLKITLLLAAVALIVAACAPDNLDITPTATPTETPVPTSTRDPQAAVQPTAEAVVSATATQVDAILAAVPDQVSGGALQWNRTEDEVTGDEIVYLNVEGGTAGKIFFSERGGGAADLTIAVFDTPEAAAAYYEQRSGDRRLENASQRDNFPQPNAFGGGTYGALALIQDGNTVIVLSVPRFNSQAGDPLPGFTRSVLAVVDEVNGG
jgi:hypothetical protein